MPKAITEDIVTGGPLIEWIVREYERHERGQLWYIGMISLGLILVVYGMFSGNFMFSLIIILAGIILFLQSQQAPQEVLFQITELGVVVGSKFYTFSEFHHFYIIYNPPEVKTLFLETKTPWRPLVRVSLGDVNPVDVRNALIGFLPEDLEKEEEPLSDTFARQWKIH